MSGRIAGVLAMVFAGLMSGNGVADALPAPCERGEMCVWDAEWFRGVPERVSLETVNPGECVPLSEGFVGRSFANRMRQPVTVYQGPACDTEGEFDTYPGGGTYVPEAPFVVRAVVVWEG